ncbi:hypothetical protein ACOSQ4_029495 [Xanthoceras sorbifolium]
MLDNGIKSGSSGSRKSDAEGSNVSRSKEFDYDLGDAKGVRRLENKHLGPGNMKKQDEQIGVEMVEGKARVLIDLDSSVMVEILEEEKGVKADVSGVVKITQSSVPAFYRSRAIVGIDKGSVLSSNSVDVSSHHLEAEGADLNVVSSPRRRSWK